MEYLTEELENKLLNLIKQKIGISIRQKDLKIFTKNIFERINANKISSASDYYQLLIENTKKSAEEWQKLAMLLTNLESYFFRDKGQIKILENYIFPELIKQNYTSKNINIISAGCSTGEEAYSLAILASEIIENIQEWNIKVLGLDINLEALEKAKKGIYGNWSLRSMPQEKKNNYFKHNNEQYEILPQYKRMVKFDYFNLVNDSWEQLNTTPNNIDLIICRNVFIYFNVESVLKVVNKFKNILKLSGFLMTGHAEVDSAKITDFQVESFPESLIYIYNPNQVNKVRFTESQKIITKNNIPSPEVNHILPVLIPEIKPFPTNNNTPTIDNFSSNNNSQNPDYNVITTRETSTKIEENLLYIETCKLIKQKSYQSAIENSKKLIEQYANNILPYQMMAEIYANIGEYSEAEKYCNLALKIDSFAVYPYYILSHLADAQGNLEETKKLLKKIIYLDSNFISAYIELANIYQLEKDVSLSQKMWKNLKEVLNKLPDSQIIPDLDNLTVAQLKEQLKTTLNSI